MKRSIFFWPILFFIFVLHISPTVSAGNSVSARTLNTKGFRLYKEGQLAKALDFFLASISKDSSYALAYYNAACVIVLLSSPCEGIEGHDDLNIGTAYRYLQKAVKLDPSRKNRIRQDPDLDKLRDNFHYYLLAGYTLDKNEDVQEILNKVHWVGEETSGGISTWKEAIVFEEGIGFTYSYLSDRHEQGTVNEENPGHGKITGSYEVNGHHVVLHLNEALEGKSVIDGELENDGALRFGNSMGPFYSAVSNCSGV